VAHVLSCLAENEVPLPALGVAWDGTGYGPDGMIWGGEFFRITAQGVERVAHLRPFRLPGGEAAVKEPRRVALGLLFAAGGAAIFEQPDRLLRGAFSATELATIQRMLQRGLNSPLTTSVGRLFDGVAALAGLRQQMRYEGQRRWNWSSRWKESRRTNAMIWPLVRQPAGAELDWAPLVHGVLSDVQSGAGIGIISAKFHQGARGSGGVGGKNDR